MWSESHVLFKSMKYLNPSLPILTYYNPQKELIIENYAGEYDQGSAQI